MSNLTFNNSKIFDTLTKETGTIVRNPEPSELCELDSMYILADWLYYASQTTMVSQELHIHLSTYLDTIPVIGK